MDGVHGEPGSLALLLRVIHVRGTDVQEGLLQRRDPERLEDAIRSILNQQVSLAHEADGRRSTRFLDVVRRDDDGHVLSLRQADQVFPDSEAYQGLHW